MSPAAPCEPSGIPGELDIGDLDELDSDDCVVLAEAAAELRRDLERRQARICARGAHGPR